MGHVILDMTMSLDGVIAGPEISREHPLGKGGRRLHDWIFDAKTDLDARLLDEIVQISGAVIVGGHTYATAIDDAWEGRSPFEVPAFVVSNRMPEHVASGFVVVTDGVESAVEQAKAAARGKHVWVMGGATTAQRCLQAGLLDELRIHVAPVVFGEGLRLFDPAVTEKIELLSSEVMRTPGAIHLKFRVIK